jgi:hypothetical protein
MDETITPQEGMNPELEVVEETVAEETTETPEELDVKTYSEEEFKQVLARAKAAEGKLRNLSPQKNITNQNSLSSEEVDVKILQSQGYTEDLITELKAVAKARGKSLFAATQDSIFIAIKAEKEATARAQSARLGASKGSSTVRKEKTTTTPGLTEEEHKQIWRDNRDK